MDAPVAVVPVATVDAPAAVAPVDAPATVDALAALAVVTSVDAPVTGDTPTVEPSPAADLGSLADSVILERLTGAVGGLVTASENLVRNQEAGTDVMNAVNETVTSLTEKVDSLVTRVSDVERGLNISNAAPADDTEQEGVDRKKGNMFKGVIFGNKG